jgi:endoglucanase
MRKAGAMPKTSTSIIRVIGCISFCCNFSCSQSVADPAPSTTGGVTPDTGSRADDGAAVSTAPRAGTTAAVNTMSAGANATPTMHTASQAGMGSQAPQEPTQPVADAGTTSPQGSSEDDAGPGPGNTDDTLDLPSLELVRRMAPGWNLGDTLDSCSMVATDSVDETTWGNPRVQADLSSALKNHGMHSVRIPVTWRHHLGPAPDYVIDPMWIKRVQEVVDYALANDLYAIINLHHDGGGDPEGGAWIRNAATDYEGTLRKFNALWTQIAAHFADYSQRLLFEDINEVGFDSLQKSEGYTRLNNLNQAFVDLIRQSQGKNPKRHLLIAGYWTDFAESSMGTVMPKDPENRSILSVHYYTPWMFCVNGEPSTWGSAAELTELRDKFQLIKTAFTDRGHAVILGEYGVNSKAERQSRMFWIEHVTKAAFDLGIAPMFWDNGEELDRVSYQWRTAGLMDAFKRATSGQDYEIVKQP